jgi:hypothetical protein
LRLERETPKHVTVFCLLYQDIREQLKVNGRLDFRELLTTVEGVKRVTGAKKGDPRAIPARG